MSERRPFREVKLQWLELLSCDADISDNAKCVALHIITRYVNGHTEEAWPSYRTIAESLGKSVKTIQRAIHDLELGGWFDVVRGNGSRVSTRYRPSENSILQACEAREKTDKVVTLNPRKGRQNCPKRRSDLSSKEGQNCHPNLKSQKNKNLTRRHALPRNEARPAISALFISKRETGKLDSWSEWFAEKGLQDLEQIAHSVCRNGSDGFILPYYYPPSADNPERDEFCFEYFQSRQNLTNARADFPQRLAS